MKSINRFCAASIVTASIAAAAIWSPVQANAAAPVVSAKQSVGQFTQSSVVRDKNGNYIIRWKANQDLGSAKVYWSTSPDQIEKNGKELARTYTRYNGLVAADPKPGQRVYFLIKGGNGATIKAAERAVELQGVVNFRDLGGYATSDGRHVKWGKLFRSGELAGLTDADKLQLKTIGLKTIIDYRSNAEVAQKPDPALSGATNIRMPAMKEVEGSSNATDLNSLIATGDLSALGKPGEMLVEANKGLVQAPDAYVSLMDALLAEKTAPIVQHCTAGKDRAGLGSAIILLTLGVSESTVMDDFLLSNVYRAEANKQAMAYMGTIIKDADALASLQALMEVRQEYLQAAIDTMKQQYGSIDGFIEKGLGVSKAERAKLQAMYLE
ncbi:protein tyrosine/serine phosphatase [Paenibacillus curdlanolyticus YK9]|uniref:Protein tyrosine/serine phosphatase n=1 Tax=Paenibacillus curdlanolyticus YK9 TaxID=717606 RepID=E0I7I5_9BACL|nr:tyrosine-protein phosphatase [Paenibacillus curdlanolyticus]EFM12001.1 protein tyrosine/serine phosphatase [Paenibacillus curdlanolyticus YK9]